MFRQSFWLNFNEKQQKSSHKPQKQRRKKKIKFSCESLRFCWILSSQFQQKFVILNAIFSKNRFLLLENVGLQFDFLSFTVEIPRFKDKSSQKCDKIEVSLNFDDFLIEIDSIFCENERKSKEETRRKLDSLRDENLNIKTQQNNDFHKVFTFKILDLYSLMFRLKIFFKEFVICKAMNNN